MHGGDIVVMGGNVHALAIRIRAVAWREQGRYGVLRKDTIALLHRFSADPRLTRLSTFDPKFDFFHVDN
jgi:hypothetical protein